MTPTYKMSVKQISDELDAIAEIGRSWREGRATPDLAVAKRFTELDGELQRRRSSGTAA